MKKRIFMALLAAVSSFAMISCDDDDKKDDPKPSGKVATEASWGETDNTVWLEMPLELEADAPVKGSASEKTVWEFTNDKCTKYYGITTCSTTELAQAIYQEALAAKNNPEVGDDGEEEDEITDVDIKGNNVYVYYKAPEDATKADVVRGAKMAVSMMNGDLNDIFGDLDFGDLDFGDLDTGDIEGYEE